MIDLRELARPLARMDFVMVFTMVVFTGVGMCFIFSAKWQGAELPVSNMYLKQGLWAAVGALGFLAMALIDYRKLAEYSYFILAGALVLLCLVFFFAPVNGSQRWIPMPGFNLQPAEIAKLACLLALARFLGRPDFNINRPRSLAAACAIVGVPFLMVFLQPDLGTALIFLIILGSMLFVAQLSWKHIGLFALAGLALAVVAFFFLLEPHQIDRLKGFFDKDIDPQGTGWNARQSKIAVASGGMHGKGFMNGTQNILGFLPRTVAPTDFIFGVIGEEKGFVGSSVVIGLYLVLFWSVFRAASLARDLLGRLIAVGVLAFLFLHSFVNIGMTVGVAPITGLPLPLVSYGGSFMVSTMMALGIVQSIIIRRDRR